MTMSSRAKAADELTEPNLGGANSVVHIVHPAHAATPAPDGSSVASFRGTAPLTTWRPGIHSRRPRRLGDRRGSRGPAGGRPRACPSRLEDVASARDVCQFPAMPCQSCDATSRATPRAPPKHLFRRRIPPSDGLAGGRDVVISPDSTDSRRRRFRPAVPSERLSAGCRGPWLRRCNSAA